MDLQREALIVWILEGLDLPLHVSRMTGSGVANFNAMGIICSLGFGF